MAVPLQFYAEPVSRPQIMLKSPVYYGGVTQLSHIRSDYDTGFNALVYISLPNNKIHFIYCQPNFHCCNDWQSIIDGFHWSSPEYPAATRLPSTSSGPECAEGNLPKSCGGELHSFRKANMTARTLEVVLNPQIRLKSKAQADEKA